MLNRTFAVNQTLSLAAFSIDPQIQGVCWAMSYDWIKRALCHLPRTQGTYTGHSVTKFSSQQRAYAQSANPQGFKDRAYLNDGLAVDRTRGSDQFNFDSGYHMIDFSNGIDSCPVGYLRLIGPGGSHGTAFSMGANGGSFFDPLYGQYAHQLGGANTLGRDIYDFLDGPPRRYAIVAWRVLQFIGHPRDHQWLLDNP